MPMQVGLNLIYIQLLISIKIGFVTHDSKIVIHGQKMVDKNSLEWMPTLFMRLLKSILIIL
jgi:hypothetical protein